MNGSPAAGGVSDENEKTFDLAVSVRAVVPKEYTREAELFGYHSGWGACLLAGVDMTFGRFASEE